MPYKIQGFDEAFFSLSNRCYDNGKISFFLFPWLPLLEKKNSLKKIMKLSIQVSLKSEIKQIRNSQKKVVMKVYPIVMTETTVTGSKPIKNYFFGFLLPFVIYLSGCYLHFKMPYSF